MEIIQKFRLGNSVPAIAAGALFYGDEQLYGEEHTPTPPTPPTPSGYSTMYFTLESLEDGNTITFRKGSYAPANTFYYSTNNGDTWAEANDTTAWSIPAAGNKILLKATADGWCVNGGNYGTNRCWIFSSTGQYKVYGNIMSMLYEDNFIGQTTLTTPNAFIRFFNNSTTLMDVSNLILPATTLTTNCYRLMFYGCSSITAAPELPATAYGDNYYGMFNGCTSLNYIKCLMTLPDMDILIMNFTSSVAATGTFVKAAGATWTTGSNGIPDGWTVVDAS